MRIYVDVESRRHEFRLYIILSKIFILFGKENEERVLVVLIDFQTNVFTEEGVAWRFRSVTWSKYCGARVLGKGVHVGRTVTKSQFPELAR